MPPTREFFKGIPTAKSLRRSGFFNLLLVEDQSSEDASNKFYHQEFHGRVDFTVARSFLEGAYLLLAHASDFDGLILDVGLVTTRGANYSEEEKLIKATRSLMPRALHDKLLVPDEHRAGGLWLWAMTVPSKQNYPTIFYSGHGERYDSMMMPLTLTGQVEYMSKVFKKDNQTATSPQAEEIDSYKGKKEYLRESGSSWSKNSHDSRCADALIAAVSILAEIPGVSTEEMTALEAFFKEARLDDDFPKVLNDLKQINGQFLDDLISDTFTKEEKDIIVRFMGACRERRRDFPWSELQRLRTYDKNLSLVNIKIKKNITVGLLFPERDASKLTSGTASEWLRAKSEYDKLTTFFQNEEVAKLTHPGTWKDNDCDWASWRIALDRSQIHLVTYDWLSIIEKSKSREKAELAKKCARSSKSRDKKILRDDNFPIGDLIYADPMEITDLLKLISSQVDNVRPIAVNKAGEYQYGRYLWISAAAWPAKLDFKADITKRAKKKDGNFYRIGLKSLGYARVVAAKMNTSGGIEAIDLAYPFTPCDYSIPDGLKNLIKNKWWIDADFRIGGTF